ncbi:hypothetical protein [Roseofilum capinflatum]|uniref:Uncharacterized protein n=1 Tax=Roseofilum capinflatum BLCC-M114 TaxID=3022440 RepID=A0ABT7B9P5_9CYAN|nr:hypothetical protein [Roseofilum capinflatum]MDJ1175877.1 hypothetical protein [Roseofilum capinflatum BLCC-M114]
MFVSYLLTSLLTLAIALSSTSIDAIPKHRQSQVRAISLLIGIISFKVIIIGGAKDNLPLILQQSQ